MATWLIPYAQLIPDQQRAIELNPREHRVIFGSPGSGKTQILLHRADYLRRLLKSDKFHIFVFTNVLTEYIRTALDLLDIPVDYVSTFDRWCRNFYKDHIGKSFPWDKDAKRPDFQKIRQKVLEKILENPSEFVSYDFVLVDEGQDLDETSFEILKLISKHVTVGIDHKQQIYEFGSSESILLKILGIRRRNVSLLEALRCTPYIVDLSAQFISDPQERLAYIQQNKIPSIEKETPVLYVASGWKDESSRLIESVRVRLAKGEKIGVFFPTRRQLFGFAKGFREAGIEVETPDNKNRNIDLSSQEPKVLTYHSAKGLTFDSVFMPRLVQSSFKRLTSELIERLLFVGISRAVKWVFMSTTEGKELPHLASLYALADQKKLTIQKYSDASYETTSEQKEPDTEQDKSDDLIDIL